MGNTKHSILAALCVVVPKTFELNADNFKALIQLYFARLEQFAVSPRLNVRVIKQSWLELGEFHENLLVKFWRAPPSMGSAHPGGIRQQKPA
jgi:hypothetical protein